MYGYSQLAKKRIFGLDLVRSISVCAVVFAHSGYQYIMGFRYGVIAIEYFFVMSGFLVGEMLIREFHNGADFKLLMNFWIKRWFRTLPLYYLILIIKIILSNPFIGFKVWPYFFFLQNNVGGIGFFSVSWTLVIEEWFYLILPLVIFIFFRSGIRKHKFIIFTIGVMVAEIILRMLYVAYKDVPWGGIVGSFPFRFDSFMIGVFVAFVKVDYPKLFQKLSGKWVAAFFLLVLIGYLGVFSASEGGQLASTVYWTRTIGFTITSVLLALQMPFLTNSMFLNGISENNLFKRIVTWISLLSYPIYLIHMDVFMYVEKYIHIPSQALHLTVCYSIITLLSYLLIVFFHQPVTESRKRFLLK
ncbi:MAG: putative acyltransferase [Bacteroidetes bacterium]|jgi:peptidoglycan/LPS O-acetylase OafA/YrhL|nr:putative acyltransferase [Bacteroidota bacterium]MDF2452231.1 putative acyltransferase [Bacteroidota bacterium]